MQIIKTKSFRQAPPKQYPECKKNSCDHNCTQRNGTQSALSTDQKQNTKTLTFHKKFFISR